MCTATSPGDVGLMSLPVNLVILAVRRHFRGRDASYLAPTGSPEAVAPPPAPTERGVRISRTTLFGS
jgi:hypothetical protein